MSNLSREPSFYQKGGKGNWYFDFYDANGKRKIRSSGTSDLEEAKAYAALFIFKNGAIEEEEKKEKQSPSLKIACDRWLASKLAGKGIARQTRVVYERAIRLLVSFFGASFPIYSLNESVMLDFVIHRQKKGGAPYSIEGECKVAKFVLSFYARTEGFTGNTSIVPVAIRGSYKPRERFLSPEEVKILLETVRDLDPHLLDYVYSYISLGVRSKELFLIERHHINLRDRTILVYCQKNKRWRRNPLTDGMVEVLSRRMEAMDSELLFPKISNWKSRMDRWSKAAKIPHFTPHDLRRTTGSLLASENVQLKTIAAILGHRSIATTAKTYAHLLDRASHEAIGRLPVASMGPASDLPIEAPRRVLSLETRKKIAAAKTGKKRGSPSEETRRKISESMKGKRNALRIKN